jgi:hypothetical protein
MNHITAMKLALDALEWDCLYAPVIHTKAIAALTAALAEPSEPVAYLVKFDARLCDMKVTDKLLVWKQSDAEMQVDKSLIQSVEPLFTSTIRSNT